MKTNFRRFLAVLYVVVFLIVVYLSNAINHSISPAKVINKTNDAPYNDDLQFFHLQVLLYEMHKILLNFSHELQG